MASSSTSVPQQADELLVRGRLALQTLQYREKAARYKAEASNLQAAILKAENGDASVLEHWLNAKTELFLEEDQPAEHIRHRSKLRPTTISSQEVSSEDGQGTTQYFRFDSVSDSVSSSPWNRMEQAAFARLEAKKANCDPVDQLPDLVKLDDVVDDTDAMEDEARTDEARTETLIESESAMPIELPESLRKALQGIELQSSNTSRNPWWKASHLWASLLFHVLIIIVLSWVIITAAQKPQILSIVSATVEADNVLTETPMEMVSEIEKTVVEPTTMSTPNPNLSDLATDVSLPAIAVEAGNLSAISPAASAEVFNSASELSQSISGNRMVAGAEFFGVKATGNTFVYIVDSSPSMRRDGAFEAAKQEMIRSLKSMKPKQRYFVSFFGKEIEPMTFNSGEVEKFPVYAKPENLAKTFDWLRQVQVQKDGWPPNDALSQAIAMQPDGIFLLFDGDTKVDVAKFLRRENRSDDVLSGGVPKVVIHVIHFFQQDFQKQMKQVAEENGGTYRFVPRPERTPKGKR